MSWLQTIVLAGAIVWAAFVICDKLVKLREALWDIERTQQKRDPNYARLRELKLLADLKRLERLMQNPGSNAADPAEEIVRIVREAEAIENADIGQLERFVSESAKDSSKEL